MNNVIIKAENINYTYSAGTPFVKTALSDINFEIEKGSFIGIIGHTGSGKSTLVQHLNGLIKPQAGKIYYNGTDIWAQPKKINEIRFKIGLVFQYPEHQLFDETVKSDIGFGPKNMGLSENEINERVTEAAEIVGLSEELLKKSPFELSGGEQRRAALAGILAMKPSVLVLDEPTAALDPKGRDGILKRLLGYQNKYKTTVILVSHSMEDIAKVAEKVMVLNKGKMAMFDTVANVFSKGEDLSKIGLNVPEITNIFKKLSDNGIKTKDNIYTVKKGAEALLPILKGGTQC